jgi:hypothetical protein
MKLDVLPSLLSSLPFLSPCDERNLTADALKLIRAIDWLRPTNDCTNCFEPRDSIFQVFAATNDQQYRALALYATSQWFADETLVKNESMDGLAWLCKSRKKVEKKAPAE